MLIVQTALSHWPLTLCTLLIIWVFESLIYNLFFHQLAHVPGPFWARISDIPNWYHTIRGRRHLWLWQLFQIYGDKIRSEPNTVLFLGPEAYADIHSTKSNVRRSNFYTAFQRHDHDQTTMNVVDVVGHAARRSILNTCFTEKSLRASTALTIRHVDRWNELLDESDGTEWSASVDFSREVVSLIFDIMGDIGSGKSFDMKEPAETPFKTIPHVIGEYVRFAYQINRSPFLKLVLWWKPRGLNRLFEAVTPPDIKRYNKFLAQSIEDRLALYEAQAKLPEDERRQDLFYFLQEAQNPDTNFSGYSKEELLAEANLLLIARTDTTAVTLSGLFFYLTGDPSRLQKLTEEIRTTFETVDEIVYGPKLLGCVYLRACIDEAMRITPTGPSEHPREVLPGGLWIKGEHYPAGVVVGISDWANSRNDEIYGDSEVFRPERWIVDESLGITAEAVSRLKSNFHPFLSGPTTCARKNLAMVEMFIVVARTLHRLDVRRTPGSTKGGRPRKWMGRQRQEAISGTGCLYRSPGGSRGAISEGEESLRMIAYVVKNQLYATKPLPSV